MKFSQSFDRTAQDSAEGEAFCIGGLYQWVAEMPGDAAYARNGNLRMTIGTDVVAEEIAEVIDHDLLYSVI